MSMDGGYYDSMDGIGRVESGTETENNAGAVVEDAYKDVSGRTTQETKSSNYRRILNPV